MTRRLIFLDVDGVLNSEAPPERARVRANATAAALAREARMTWFALDDDGGVLELDDPQFELHLARNRCRLVAWWETAEGELIRRATVGAA